MNLGSQSVPARATVNSVPTVPLRPPATERRTSLAGMPTLTETPFTTTVPVITGVGRISITLAVNTAGNSLYSFEAGVGAPPGPTHASEFVGNASSGAQTMRERRTMRARFMDSQST